MVAKINNIWTKLIGTSQSELNGGLAVGSDGSIYISGSTEGDLDGQTHNGGTTDLFISKFDSNGIKKWTKLVGNTDNEKIAGAGLAIGSDDSIYIAGITNPVLSAPGNQGTFISKFNPDGTQKWLIHYGLSEYEEGFDLIVGSDNSLYFTGYTYGDLDNQLNNGSRDAFIRKINAADGSIIWTRLIGSSEEDWGNKSTIAVDGSIYITGLTKGNLDNQTNNGDWDTFLTKFNPDGTKQWTKVFGTSKRDRGIGIATDTNGSIYITGATYGDLDGEKNNGTEDAFLTKFNPDGTKQWTKILGTSSIDLGIGVTIGLDDSIYISGYTAGNLDNQTNSIGTGDLFVSKFDSYGTKKWTQLIGAQNPTNIELSISENGTLYISGDTSGGLNGQSNSGNQDAFIAKFSEVNDSEGITINGTELNDTLNGTSKNDTINGLGGNDIITGDSGDDLIDGGSGSDTAIYSGKFADYSFTRSTNSIQIVDQRITTNDGRDTLSNIEYIQFSDQTIDELKVDVFKNYTENFRDYKFYDRGNGKYEIRMSWYEKNPFLQIIAPVPYAYDDITGIPKLIFQDKPSGVSAVSDIKGVFDQITGLNSDSGEMFRLYNAAFARFPDTDGLKYWIDKFSSGQNTRRVVAKSFLISDEFKQRYGANVSDSTYVNTLYKNVLDRDADSGGLNYWLSQLNSGAETRYEVLLGFAESAENKALFTEMTGFG